MIVLAGVIRERVRRLRVRHAAKARFAARLGARFFVLQSNVEQAIGPRCLIHAEQALIYVVADRVVKRRGVVADHEHDHADMLVRHE